MAAPLLQDASRKENTRVQNKALRRSDAVSYAAHKRTQERAREREEGYKRLREQGYIGRKNQTFTEKGRGALQRQQPLAQTVQKMGAFGVAKTAVNRAKATTAAIMIFWFAIVFWIPQIAFWVIGILGIGIQGSAEGVFLLGEIVKYVVPGDEIFILSYIVIVCIGIMTMLYAAAIFVIRGVDGFGGMKSLIFGLCIAGYLTFFINFFPWFIIYIASVVYFQNED